MQVIVDGLAISNEDVGSGPAVLMLHGWQSDIRSFDGLAAELSKQYRVLRLDLPGFGGSQPPNEPWGVAEYTDFISRYLEKMKVSSLHAVIGHSMGGRIALFAAAHKKLEAKRLVLIGAAGIPESKSLRARVFYVVAKTGKMLAKVLPSSSQQKLKAKLYGAAGSTDYLEAGAMKDTFSRMINEDARKYAATIKTKTLLVYGEHDDQAPPSFGEVFAQLIPNSQLEVIAEAGHYAHQDQPQKVHKIIMEFLQ